MASPKLPIKDILAAIDMNAKSIWKELSRVEKSGVSFWLLNRYVSAIQGSREDQELAIFKTNEYYNKHFNTIGVGKENGHQELMWQLLCMSGAWGEIKFHPYIGFKKKSGSNNNTILKFLEKLYPNKTKLNYLLQYLQKKNLNNLQKNTELKMSSSDKPYVCEYCNTGYTREKTLAVHMCQPKRRALQKNEKRVQLGLYTFNQFYKLSAGAKKEKTYEDFCKSPYYNAFVKFGSFINNVRPLYTEKYIDYVVTSGVKLDQWCRDELYEKYAIELIKKEDVQTALERSIITMMDWADESDSQWNHYFNYVSLNRAIYHIKDGKISPWLILNCKSGKEMLSKFNDEQLAMVFEIVNPEHWATRFRRQKNDVETVKEVVKESNL